MHDHYCVNHDVRWKCSISPCTQHEVLPCTTCRCGRTMEQVTWWPDALYYRCPLYYKGSPSHDSLDFQRDSCSGLVRLTVPRQGKNPTSIKP